MSRWVPINSSLYEILAEGRLSPKAFLALIRMFTLADYKSGIWNGCAIALAAACGPSFDVSGTQKILNALEKGGFIKRFRSSAQRGNYEIAIADFMCTAGPYANKFVVLGNAVCQEDLVYESRGSVAAPVEAAPTVALHPDVAKLEKQFADSGKVVHAASREAMSNFLNKKKCDLDYVSGMLNFAFTSSFWSPRIPRWESFETAYSKETLPKQYRAWLKKQKKGTSLVPKLTPHNPPPGGTAPDLFLSRPIVIEPDDDESVSKAPDLYKSSIVLEPDDDDDETDFVSKAPDLYKSSIVIEDDDVLTN